MIPLFLGLTAANLIVLLLTFSLGLFAVDDAQATSMYGYHIGLGIAAGLLTAMTHLAVYTYFMATSRWLQAAALKANLDLDTYARPALARKSKAFAVVMAAVVMTMLTMFAGAGADSTVRPWWPSQVHLVMGGLCIAVNLLCAQIEYRLIVAQGALMDRAIEAVNQSPAAHGLPSEQA